MNWWKIVANGVGAAAGCLLVHGAAGQGVQVVSSGAAWLGAGLCVLSNLAGLFQSPPAAKT